MSEQALQAAEAREEVLEINLGPHHPSTHGVFRAIVELDGEIVLNVTPYLGYLHRGYEKTCENKHYHQVIPLTERCDYMGASSNSLVYCLCVERIIDVPAPERAQAIRVIMAELSRIFSHLFWLGTHAHDVGAMTPLFYTLREREEIMNLFELVAGGRLMPNYLRIGGLNKDLEEGFIERLGKFTETFDERVDDYETLLTKNAIYMDRTKGVGVLPLQDAIALGASGPVIRGSGLAWDIRKTEPYSGYEQYQFDIPVEYGCDVYSRYLVRIEELRQSNRILKQAIRKMPDGPVIAKKAGVIFPPQADIYTRMESLIHHFMLVVEGMKPPVGEYYQCIESPRGELGCFLISDGGPNPFRLKWRAPAFVNLESLTLMTKGCFFADLIAILSSVDIVLAEVDR
ncbi:MAG: NADH-quinone oxidoreductase subunit [Thermodesulfobacteriota bacterium]|nr:NADH-quinone oxidoreductase subunit [Thermodesulfobacteriota bacterium]